MAVSQGRGQKAGMPETFIPQPEGSTMVFQLGVVG